MEKISICIGAVGTVLGFLSFQTKNKKTYLIYQILSNLMVAASFLFLGLDRLSGGLLCFAAIFQGLLNYRYVSKNEPISRWSVIFFFILYSALTLVPEFVQGALRFPYSFCPFFCAVFFLLSICAKEGKTTRIFGACNSAVWIIYDMFGVTFALSNFATHTLLLISTIIGILRYDIRHNKNDSARA